jgi:hypothetical protein
MRLTHGEKSYRSLVLHLDGFGYTKKINFWIVIICYNYVLCQEILFLEHPKNEVYRFLYKKYRSLIYIIPLPSVQCVGKKRTVIGKALMNVTIVSEKSLPREYIKVSSEN